jgi:predicted RNase H-like HicB family nuclease
MIFDVILQKQTNNGYIARPVLWPDSAVHGATEEEALSRVHGLIRDLLERTQFVKLEVDVPEKQALSPWYTKAGIFADDPTWEDFLQTMADYRHQLDDK